jgi:alkylhydroperoxidase family enzyme
MAAGSTAPLVSLVSKEEAPPAVRAVYDQAEPVYGRLLHTWQALAQRPEIFTAYLPYLRSIIGPGELEQRTKELVEVRTVVLCRCLYSTSHRVRSARAAGVPEEDIVAVARGDMSGFNARERLALALAEALTVSPAAVPYADAPQLVPSDMLARLQAEFSEPQIVELVATIGLWNALARFHRVMGFELDMDAPPDEVIAEL